MENHSLDIINAGMFRGGTSSLSLALQELGFGPTWHLITNSKEMDKIGSKWWVENNISDKLINGATVNFDEWLQQIQCKTIMDTPIVWCWEQIFAQYPEAKVIICVRPFEEWSKSYLNLLKVMNDPKMDVAETMDPWIKERRKLWHYNFITNDYNGMKQFLSLEKSKQMKILKEKYYDKHIERAKEIVPSKQLLIFNPSDGWEPLCKFLNVSIPCKPYPNTNNTSQLNATMSKWKDNAILSNVNIYYILVLIVGILSVLYLIIF